MKILIGATLILLCSLSAFAGDKCLQRKDLNSMYDSHHMKYVENYGHVLAINSDEYDRELGYTMDVYAQKSVGIKDKKTNEISHYKKCLIQIKKKIKGKYIYGSFSRSGVQIRFKEGVQRVSFVGK